MNIPRQETKQSLPTISHTKHPWGMPGVIQFFHSHVPTLGTIGTHHGASFLRPHRIGTRFATQARAWTAARLPLNIPSSCHPSYPPIQWTPASWRWRWRAEPGKQALETRGVRVLWVVSGVQRVTWRYATQKPDSWGYAKDHEDRVMIQRHARKKLLFDVVCLVCSST